MTNRVVVCFVSIVVIGLGFSQLPFEAHAFKSSSHKSITRGALSAITGPDFALHAIERIVEANVNQDAGVITNTGPFTVARYHFDNETFSDSTKQLRDWRDEIIEIITDPETCDASIAHETLGKCLHLIQDFYAHSNWVDNGNPGIMSAIDGINILSDPGQGSPSCVNPTDNDPVVGSPLTTGYYYGHCGNGEGFLGLGDPILPPNGKCYHGITGLACNDHGGINKDAVSDPLHTVARSLAQVHSQNFVEAIFSDPDVASNDRAKLLLSGRYLEFNFCVDDTESMVEELPGVKQQITAMVNLPQLQDRILLYRLIPFDNVTVGPVFETIEKGQFLEELNSLVPNGGGQDCPELANRAVRDAIELACEGAYVFCRTDATSQEPELYQELIMKAMFKDVALDFIVTGSCSPLDATYQELGLGSGGNLVLLDPNENAAALSIFESRLDPREAIVARYWGQYSDTVYTDSTWTVPIDSALETLNIRAFVQTEHQITITKPSGATLGPASPGVEWTSFASGVLATIDAPEVGMWTITAGGKDVYDVLVSGPSDVRFESFDEVVHENPVHPGFFRRPGNPGVQPAQYLARISESNLTNVAFGLVNADGSVLESIVLDAHVDATSEEFVGIFGAPQDRRFVVVDGIDGQGDLVQRYFPRMIQGSAIVVEDAPESYVEALESGEDTLLEFRVRNEGATPRTTVISIEDLTGILDFSYWRVDGTNILGPLSETIVLDPGEEVPVEVYVYIPSFFADGTTADFMIRAASGADSDALGRRYQAVHDCNDNFVGLYITDQQDVTFGWSLDCNNNLVPDECEVDCNLNGIPDECDIANGVMEDCNLNGFGDECEMFLDYNGNGVIDECELDCNGNGSYDYVDIAAGFSSDANANGIPDECDPDCDGSGLADILEIQAGILSDCNENWVPDSCEIAAFLVTDFDGNGVPDPCDPDCDGNGLVDVLEIEFLGVVDCNVNWVPDVCETPSFPNPFIRGDATGDGVIGLPDILTLLDYVYSGVIPPCLDALDVNDSGCIDIVDSIYLQNYAFLGGPEPAPPFPGCGKDQTPDWMDCDLTSCP